MVRFFQYYEIWAISVISAFWFGVTSAAGAVGTASLNLSAEAIVEDAEKLVATLKADLDECLDSLSTAEREKEALLSRLDDIKLEGIDLNAILDREKRKAAELEVKKKSLSSHNEFLKNFHTLISRLCSQSEVFFLSK